MQAIVYLTRNSDHTAVSARKIADDLDIPKEFVSKILQSLVNKGLLGSRKGKGGGFYITTDPADINVDTVFSALGYSEYDEGCFLGLKGICTETICDICRRWMELNEEFDNVIKRISIQKLSEASFKQINK